MSESNLIRVSDELKRRRNQKAGLENVHVLHEPSGHKFVCRTSSWNAQSKLELLGDDGKYPVDECLLLTEWPVPNSIKFAIRPTPKKRGRQAR